MNNVKIILIAIALAAVTAAPAIYFLGAEATLAHIVVAITWVSGIHPTLILTFVTIIALYVSLSEGRRSQKHQHLSVQPYLTAQMKVSKTELKADPKIKLECLEIKIVNRGIGPAVVTDFTLFLGGAPLVAKKDHKDYQLALKEKILNTSVGKSTTMELTSIASGDIVAIGEEQMVLKIEYNPKDENEETVDKFYQLDLQIQYQSMYELDMPPCDTRD